MDINSCPISGHGGNPLTFLCLDPSCNQQQKSACFGCLYYNHKNHFTLEYSEIYKQISNLENQSNTAKQDDPLSSYIDRKRENMLADVREAIYLLDLHLFEDIYTSEEQPSSSNNQKSYQSLLNQFSQIKNKPFYSMNNSEIQTVISLYKQAEMSGSKIDSQTSNNNNPEKEKINVKYMNTKKDLMNFIAQQTERIINNETNQGMTLGKQNEQNTQLEKKIKDLEKELLQTKERNTQLSSQVKGLSDDLSTSNIRLQSLKEAQETLKNRNKILEQQADNSRIAVTLQQKIISLESQLSSANKQNINLENDKKAAEMENEELKEVVMKAKLALEIYQIKFQQIAEELQENKRAAALANLKAALASSSQQVRVQPKQNIEIQECRQQ